MQYKKIEGMSYNLHLVKTDKFKKTMIKIVFRTKTDKQAIVDRKLISDILITSNSVYNTKRLLEIKTEDLYNLALSNEVLVSGNVIMTSFTALFLNDKYAEEGLLKDAIKFLCDIIFKPLTKDDKFDLKALNLSKDRLKEEIISINENPNMYAMDKIYKIMGKNTSLQYSMIGDQESLDNVTEESLYKEYLKMLKSDTIDIYVAGNIDMDKVSDILKEEFVIKTKKKNSYIHEVEHKKVKNRFRTYKDEIDNKQSVLILGYKLKDVTKFEKEYVLPIYSYILGGGPDSKLFRNVREANSLCYTVSSQIRTVSNFMFIKAGINRKDFNKAVKLIKKEVDKMKDGSFEESEIEKAKITYLTAYKEMSDSLTSIVNHLISHECLNTDLIEDKEKEIVKVTKEDILNVIPKMHMDTIYFLEGMIEDEENSSF